MKEAVEHGGDGSTVSQQFSPVFHGSVGGHKVSNGLVGSFARAQRSKFVKRRKECFFRKQFRL